MGYLPEQSSPASRFFPEFARARSPRFRTSSTGRRSGPRLSAAYDLSGDGRTGLKFAAGRYYYVIAVGRRHPRWHQPERQLLGELRVERRQRRPPLPARRTDRHPGDLARRRVDGLDRSRLHASLHRRVHGRPRSRALPGPAPERDRHAPRGAEPAGHVEPGESVRHVPDHARRHRPRRRGRHVGRRRRSSSTTAPRRR